MEGESKRMQFLTTVTERNSHSCCRGMMQIKNGFLHHIAIFRRRTVENENVFGKIFLGTLTKSYKVHQRISLQQTYPIPDKAELLESARPWLSRKASRPPYVMLIPLPKVGTDLQKHTSSTGMGLVVRALQWNPVGGLPASC